ncbi:MAG TPA: hypothetical protein VEY51_19285 [Chondromyces sp.]|nr:hypothetical protein [Chondromyces sp.]
MRRLLSLCVLLLILGACQQDYPEPESFQTIQKADAAQTGARENKWLVRHVVQGDQLFVECILPNITFNGKNKNGAKKGKIVVSVDGLRFNEYHTAAFIMKGLDKGTHQVTVEIYSLNNKPLGMKRSFYVTIV